MSSCGFHLADKVTLVAAIYEHRGVVVLTTSIKNQCGNVENIAVFHPTDILSLTDS